MAIVFLSFVLRAIERESNRIQNCRPAFFLFLSPLESVSTDFALVGKFIARLNECKPTAWDVSINLYTVFLFVVIEETCFTSSKTLSVGDSVPLNSTIKMCLANCQKNNLKRIDKITLKRPKIYFRNAII